MECCSTDQAAVSSTGKTGRILRGSSGNSDSMVSGSLASPMSLGGGERKERGDETRETESRGDLDWPSPRGRGGAPVLAVKAGSVHCLL